MSMGRMKQEEVEWLKNFNYAMTGNKKAFEKICPDKDKFEVIFKDMETKRNMTRKKDLMQKGQSIGPFIADIDYVIQKHEISRTWAEHISKNETHYTTEDYKMFAKFNSIENAMVEYIDNKQVPKRTRLSSIKDLSIGTEVKVWIEDHVYDKEIGIVIAMRSNGQYLIEITSRRASKRNNKDSSAVAQMWVYANEIRIYP